MTELIIASGNKGKIREIRQLLPFINILTLDDIVFTDEIPEPYHTFRENAHTKATTIYNFCHKNTFAEDSGICVPYLNNEPGVFSARYAGLKATDGENLQKLLNSLAGIEERNAFYKAVICLIWEEHTYYFEGECHGKITDEPRGTDGFGYDPIFVPEGYEKTFAELPPAIKNEISHRGKAVRKMIDFLAQNNKG